MNFKVVDPIRKRFKNNPIGWEILLLFFLGMIVLLFIMNWMAHAN